MVVKNGDKVKVEYTGTFENGEVFDSSKSHGNPLEFEVGANQVVKGFDDAVVGMDLNEEKEVTINPEDGYGAINKDLVKKFPKDQFPPEVKEGMMIGIGLPDGKQIPALVAKIEEKEVTVDLNHPMAGKKMIFKIKVVSIN